MNTRNTALVAALLLTAFAMQGCIKRGEFDDIPTLAFHSYASGDTLDAALGSTDPYVRLKFSFTDGDGDLGLRQEDVNPPFDYNLFANYYELENGNFVHKGMEPSRITDLEKYANRHGLQGYIEISYFKLKPGSVIRYEVYILDRKLQKSNTVTTPVITIN